MWLYVPGCEPSASAQAALVSTSDWNWQSQVLAQSATWRGKHSPPRTWLQRCNRVSWLQRLCGAMCEPSTADRGVASWMASLAGSHASPIAWPGEREASTTSATCGPTPVASSSSPAPDLSSLRTSPVCSRRGLTKSLEPSGFGVTYADWVTSLRADYSRRQKLARRTKERGSSSSRWPTPAARDFKGANGPDHMENGTGRLHMDQLPNFVSQWSTPRASDGEKGGPNQAFGAGGVPLPAQTVTWAARGGDRSDELLMRGQAAQLSQWLTPRVSTGDYTRDGGDADKERLTYEGQAKALSNALWPTPTSLSFGESPQPGNSRSYNLTMEKSASLSSLLAPETSRGGAPSSLDRRSLNPRFVEWLMGWPLGLTNFDCSEMAWSRWQQHMRSALLALDLPADPRPQQMSLWG